MEKGPSPLPFKHFQQLCTLLASAKATSGHQTPASQHALERYRLTFERWMAEVLRGEHLSELYKLSRRYRDWRAWPSPSDLDPGRSYARGCVAA